MKTNINLTEFQASKISIEESINTNGGGGTATTGRSTSTSASDRDCTHRDCEANPDTISL